MNENVENRNNYSSLYTIEYMEPRSGEKHRLADKWLGRYVYIIFLCVGERAILACETPEECFDRYLHLSTVESVNGKIGDNQIVIETRNTTYVLIKNH